MRPTDLKFRHPRERTPEHRHPTVLVSYQGTKLYFKPAKNESSNKQLTSFGKAARFSQYSDWGRSTTSFVGPTSYQGQESFNRLNASPCPVLIKRNSLGKETSNGYYQYQGSSLVFQPSYLDPKRKKLYKDLNTEESNVNISACFKYQPSEQLKQRSQYSMKLLKSNNVSQVIEEQSQKFYGCSSTQKMKRKQKKRESPNSNEYQSTRTSEQLWNSALLKQERPESRNLQRRAKSAGRERGTIQDYDHRIKERFGWVNEAKEVNTQDWDEKLDTPIELIKETTNMHVKQSDKLSSNSTERQDGKQYTYNDKLFVIPPSKYKKKRSRTKKRKNKRSIYLF